MRLIASAAAPPAVGPYSHAVLIENMLYCSGQVGLMSDGKIADGVAEQMAQALTNLEEVCRTAGTNLAQAVRMTIYLTDLNCFGDINRIYEERLAGHRPARTTVQVAALPLSAAVEVDAIVCCREKV